MSPSSKPPASQFELTVRGASGKAERIKISACSEADAVRCAVGAGRQVLAVEALSASRSSVSSPAASFPLLLFSQELLALLDAGLNLNEALNTLHAKERQGAVSAVLGTMLVALQQGCTLSDALARFPQCFPAIYVATVRASEQTGDLPQTLARYVAYQIQVETIRKKLVSAAIYPVMLLIVGGFVTLFLLGYVVPRFAAVYDSSGNDMPWMSMLLLHFGRFIHGHWLVVGGTVAGLFGASIWAATQPSGRAWLMSRFVALPWVAERAHEFRLARFYRAVGMLLASGIALPKALTMVAELLSPQQQHSLAVARVAIEQGQRLSDAFVLNQLATPVAESLIKVGERTGQMADMLERIARFQDEAFSRWVDWASKLLEPILMTLMGLVIGLVVVLMYMPIFDLAGSLQ